MSKVYVSETKKTGKGLFAKVNLKEGEAIFIAKGRMVKYPYYPDYKIGPNRLAMEKHIWLDPFDKNPWRFINHSCNPNAGLKGRRIVVAMKNIKKNKEVTIDYSITEEDPNWKMKCICSEKNCRKVIKSVRFLPLKLFEKYKNYIPEFMQEAYASTHHNN